MSIKLWPTQAFRTTAASSQESGPIMEIHYYKFRYGYVVI
jgi:hypothetical protein